MDRIVNIYPVCDLRSVSGGLARINEVYGMIVEELGAQLSAELGRRHRALGGKIELLTIPGEDHEEIDAFFECQPLVDFLIWE